MLTSSLACKSEWSETCESNDECCSGFCDDQDGRYPESVCMQKNLTNCLGLYNKTCNYDRQCCSNNCFKQNPNSTFGVCYPKPKSFYGNLYFWIFVGLLFIFLIAAFALIILCKNNSNNNNKKNKSEENDINNNWMLSILAGGNENNEMAYYSSYDAIQNQKSAPARLSKMSSLSSSYLFVKPEWN